jgi:hypothetical protein
MGLEAASFISQLVAANPNANDNYSMADDHLRLLKAVLLATFPNLSSVVNATPAELNRLVGVTSDVQTQLNALSALFGALQGRSVSGAADALVLTDAGRYILHANGAGAGDGVVIPLNASVAFSVGTQILLVNRDSANWNISATPGASLFWAGTTASGDRTLGQNGMAMLFKAETNIWMISGAGLT